MIASRAMSKDLIESVQEELRQARAVSSESGTVVSVEEARAIINRATERGARADDISTAFEHEGLLAVYMKAR